MTMTRKTVQKMKKQCGRCRALEMAGGHYWCDLGYSTKYKIKATGLYVLVPTSSCPKPLTIKNFLRLKRVNNELS